MAKKRAIIIHGWGGTANSGWKGWLRGELERRGWQVHSPQMPNSENPRMDEWLSVVEKLAGRQDGNLFLVGHSLGCIAILRHLEMLKTNERVGGAVLVAGFSDDLGMPELKDFFPRPFDFGKIKFRCKKFVALHSTDDRYVDVKYGREFEAKLGAKLVVLRNMGHFSASEGIRELPAALEALLLLAGEERE